MDPQDFQNLPKDQLCDITDIHLFKQFIVVNSIKDSSQRLLTSLFNNKKTGSLYISNYIQKQLLMRNVIEFIEHEFEKYISVSDIEEGIDGDNNICFSIKHGDITNLIINISNYLLYNTLSVMTDDKILKFCWDSKNESFIWVFRKDDDKDPEETKPKKTRKRKKS